MSLTGRGSLLSLCSNGKFHLEMKSIAGLSEQVRKEHFKGTLNYMDQKSKEQLR